MAQGTRWNVGVHIAPCSHVLLWPFPHMVRFRRVQSKCAAYAHTKHVYAYRLPSAHFQTNHI